jgi:hypothetical protein
MSPTTPDLSTKLAEIHEQLAFLARQLAALSDQQMELIALVHDAITHKTQEGTAPAGPPQDPAIHDVLVRCGQDIVRVLGDVGRPLTTLEILDELVHRHLSWRESTVSHALAELGDQGRIVETGPSGAHRHALVTHSAHQGATAG